MITRAKHKQIFGPSLLGAIFCLFTFALAVSADCGFGWTKIDAVLKRKKPPEVYLIGTTIRVTARAQVNEARNYTAPLATQIESSLINSDRRLSVEHSKPDTVISCIITSLTSSEKWENRKTTESKKVGEKQVWNDKKKKYETKDDIKSVEVTKSYKVIDSSMNVSYQVTDTKSNTQLAAGNIPASFSKSFQDGNGAPTLQEVEQTLISQAVAIITSRLTPTFETVKVLLPKCEFEHASKLGESGLWQRMLETLIKMSPSKNPKDDAYRYYAMGVANEALAYQSENIETTKKLLDDARENFSKAIDLKPEEKYFREPEVRIGAAIAQYQKITEQQAEYANALKSKSLPKQNEETAGSKTVERPVGATANTGVRKTEPLKSPSDTLTNQSIILLVKKDTGEALILKSIKIATKVQFDISPDGISDLKDNKVSENIIMAMMEKQSATKPPTTKRSPAQTRRRSKP